MTVEERSAISNVGETGVSLGAVIKGMRPRQWTKNLLVFAPLTFDLQLDDVSRDLKVVAAFAVMCAVSSAVYLVNDVLDIERDRIHPVKRYRPIAAGLVSARLALIVAGLLAISGFLSGYFLNPFFGAVAVLYFALNLVYSFWLKHVVILDVFGIAAGFVLRAAGGAVVIDIPISPWLYVCTVLLALFLAFGKRRNEVMLLEDGARSHRRNLDEYTEQLLDQLILLTAAVTLMAYSLYTFSAPNLPDNHSMMLTIPFVLYGLFRYLYLVYSRGEGGAPDQILVRDAPLLLTVVLWAATAIAILYQPLS